MNVSWVHDKDDNPRVRLDASLDFVPGQEQAVADASPSYAAPIMAGTGAASDADLVCIVRKVFKDAGILSSSEVVMSIVGIWAYVRGRLAR